MEMKRRQFIQGMLVGGGVLASSGVLAAVTNLSKSSPAAAAKSQLWLQTGSARESEFAHGLAQTHPQELSTLSLNGHALTHPGELQRLIAKHANQQLVGLMEDSHFLLLHELVRSAGGRALYTGQHSWDVQANRSHHEILTTPQTQDMGNALSHALTSRGQQVVVNQLHSKRPSVGSIRTELHLPSQGDWPELVGTAMGQIGSNGTMSYAAKMSEQHPAATHTASTGSLVSFVLEI